MIPPRLPPRLPPTLLLLPLALGLAAPGDVTLKDIAFRPANLSVSAGESVTWRNADSRDYTVTAEDGSFDSGTLGPGKSFTHAFPRPGRYPYASRIHPRMKGVVTVTE